MHGFSWFYPPKDKKPFSAIKVDDAKAILEAATSLDGWLFYDAYHQERHSPDRTKVLIMVFELDKPNGGLIRLHLDEKGGIQLQDWGSGNVMPINFLKAAQKAEELGYEF